MTVHQARIIDALAHNQLSTIQAARSMNYHRNTIWYHVREIRKTTGLNPYDFFDMQKLYPLAREVLSRA